MPLVFAVAREAVVNAGLVQVRAPMEGVIAELRLRVGDAVSAEDPLVRLVNPVVDTAQLSKLKTHHAEVCARQKRLASELMEVEAAEKAYRKTANIYRDGRTTMLKASVRETSAMIEAAKGQHARAVTQARRTNVLFEKNATATADVEFDKEGEWIARKRIEQLDANLTRTKTELEATGQGVFLQTETPYCVQRAQELALNIPLLRALLSETEELCAALTPELAREQQRVEALWETTPAPPASGIVSRCPS